MRAILLLSLFFVFSAQAKDFKLDKDTFLKRVDENRISLDKSPVANIPDSIKPQLLASQKKQFPGFQEEMWYAAYIDSDKYRYYVFYEWYNRGCVFGISEPSKYKKGDDSANNAAAVKEYQSLVKIDERYCEKALGIKVPRGGLKGTDLYKFKGESK